MVAEGGTAAVSSAALVKATVQPVVARPQAAAPIPSPAGPSFLSPRVELDPRSNLVVVQYRDAETGDVVRQYPSEAVVREYKRQQDATVEVTPTPQAPETPSPPAPSAAQPETPLPVPSGSHLSIDA